MSKTPDRVVIAIDPHKASWTAATAIVRCAASPVGGPATTWAIEGASGLGAP